MYILTVQLKFKVLFFCSCLNEMKTAPVHGICVIYCTGDTYNYHANGVHHCTSKLGKLMKKITLIN